MTNIQFENDLVNQRAYVSRDNAGRQMSTMSAWLVKHGFSKSASGAQVVLIAIVLINFIIMFILLKFFL